MRAGFNLHHSDLQEFLFAPIWDEKNGTPLSILSALARLGLDPWGEAARLADMPRAGAASALAAILAKLPRNEQEVPDYAKISQHLVQFLPEGGSKPSDGTAGNSSGNGSIVAIANVISVQNIVLILALAAVLVTLQVNGWLL